MDEHPTIDSLQQRLTELRREFAYYLTQEALLGRAALPYQIARKIDELSDAIQQTQQALRDLGAPADGEM